MRNRSLYLNATASASREREPDHSETQPINPYASPHQPVSAIPAELPDPGGAKSYKICYGSAFSVCKFGFVRDGEIAIGPSVVTLSGNKHWSVGARMAVFFAITVLPALLFGFGLRFLLALVVIHYFCASPGQVTLPRKTVSGVTHSGRKITFQGRPSDGGKPRTTVFKAQNVQPAQEIEALLGARSVPRGISAQFSAPNRRPKRHKRRIVMETIHGGSAGEYDSSSLCSAVMRGEHTRTTRGIEAM